MLLKEQTINTLIGFDAYKKHGLMKDTKAPICQNLKRHILSLLLNLLLWRKMFVVRCIFSL